MSNEGLPTSDWFELIVEGTPDAILVADRSRRITLVNRSAEVLFGYSREELVGQFLEILVPERFRAGHPGHVASFFATPKARSMGAGRDLYGLRKDGVEVPIEIGLNPIETPGGLFTLASIIDITERRKAEERFRLVVEAAPNAMLMADRNRRITMVNRTAEALFGYSREELIDQPLEMLVPERFRAGHPGLVASFFTNPKARSMGAGRDLYGLRKDGVEVPIEIGLNPMETPSGLFTLASIIDITERRGAEERFRLVVEAAPNAMLMADRNRRITMVNRNAETLFGYSRAELVGQLLEFLVPERFRAGHPGHVANFFATPKARSMGAGRDLYGLRKDGVEVPIEIGLNPIETGGGLFTLASIIDITERKRNEDQLRRSNAELEHMNNELDDFVHTASHDLRAPLNGVSTVAQWILRDDSTLSAESRERLQIISGRIQRMKRLLDDIRDYARAGRATETIGTALSAAALVADVAAMSHVPAGFLIRPDVSLEKVNVTRAPLEQVIHNLISNAVKHHDQQAGLVTISVHERGPWLRFSVIDDGPGVPSEYREEIFEMFRTLKPRDEVEGSGMGLALVRKIVERMGGSCGVEAAPGRGAHFWFDWPRSGQPVRGQNEPV
jgi:PAS domain S-box-containing protein